MGIVLVAQKIGHSLNRVLMKEGYTAKYARQLVFEEMKIKNYYLNDFRSDLAHFMPDVRLPYFGHSWNYDCSNLKKTVPTERRAVFLICLYFTVLVDQAMHSHYPSQYSRFEELTRYPKFCHGLGQFQKNPRAILSVPADKGFVEQANIETHLLDGMNLFVDEIATFFEEHMPTIETADFFNRLIYDPDVQIPELVVMVNEEMKDDVVYKAYKALRAAVDARYADNS